MAAEDTEPKAFVRRMVVKEKVDASTGQKFSLMTYNILNDRCIRDDYKYCPEENRYMPFRSRLIVSEIKQYNPDLICMQEVQPAVFADMLKPPLESLGYDGIYHERAGSSVQQGDAVFYRQDMFTLDEVKAVRFHDLVKQEFTDLDGLDPLSCEALGLQMDLPDQVVLVRFQHKATGKYIHLASVHVLWGNLKRPDKQAMEVCSAIRSLEKFMSGYDDPVYIIAGDFNTPPTFPLYQMLEDTNAPNAASHEKLAKVLYKRKDGKMESMIETAGKLFKIDLKFVSSYKNIMGKEPEITNLDDGFTPEPAPLCLDYIWFSPTTLEVTGVLETPPTEALTKHGGLPSVLFGSDHLPLLTQFHFN